MAGSYKKRREFVAEFMAANPSCYYLFDGCWGRASTVNELIRRSHQGAIYPEQPGKRENQYFAACVPCHDRITFNPEWAREMGYEVI